MTVAGGDYYRASAEAYAGEGAEAAFVRVSWYGSHDGSGPALSSVDSIHSATTTDGGFRRLATEAVQAPAGAASAKLRLMLRPLSDQPTIAYFDAASFSPAEPGAAEVVLAAARSLSGNADASVPGGAAEEPSSASPETRLRLANIKPVATPAPSSTSLAGGGNESWAIALAILVAVAAITVAGGYELWQRRIGGEGGTLPDD